jgi:hypothetical protein
LLKLVFILFALLEACKGCINKDWFLNRTEPIYLWMSKRFILKMLSSSMAQGPRNFPRMLSWITRSVREKRRVRVKKIRASQCFTLECGRWSYIEESLMQYEIHGFSRSLAHTRKPIWLGVMPPFGLTYILFCWRDAWIYIYIYIWPDTHRGLLSSDSSLLFPTHLMKDSHLQLRGQHRRHGELARLQSLRP